MRLSDLPAGVLAPVQHLLEGKPADLEFPDPTGWHVLVLQYIRPKERALVGGGVLHLPDSVVREDEFQGRVGVVLAVGPEAYRDVGKYPGGPWCKPGDWVLWPAVENGAMRQRYHGLVVGLLADDRVVAVGVDPRAMMEGS